VGKKTGPQTHDHNSVKGLLLSVKVELFFESENICQSYKQDRGCLMHFARLANTLLKDEGSARDNHVLAGNFAKYSPIKKFTFTFAKYSPTLIFFAHRLSNKPFLT